MNPCKYFFYSDIFNGFADNAFSSIRPEEYLQHAKTLKDIGQNSRFRYIFDSMSALCEVLAIKCRIGSDCRKAYKEKNKTRLANICDILQDLVCKVDEFYIKFAELWFMENKPQGFDVQDIRIGGLLQGIKACEMRLQGCVAGEINSIPELDTALLPFPYGAQDKLYCDNVWVNICSVNIL